jgi:hypothetical protein
MRNVAPSRSLVRRANQVKTLAFVVGAAGIFALAVGILFNAVPLVAVENPGFGLYNFVRGLALFAGVIMIVAALAMGIRAFTWKVDNDLAIEVGRILSPNLNDDYTLIRNISKLAIGYVDAALVGPPGVLIFRLFDGAGSFINEGENWMRVKGRTQTGAPDVAPLSFSPTRQTQADMDKVAAYLKRHNLSDVPIFGMVVMMKNPPAARIERLIAPQLPVTQLPELWQTLQRAYLIHAELDKPKADAVVRALYGDIL